MKEQQDSFQIPDLRYFKSDQLSEESLRFKVASIEREILKLSAQNAQLKKTLDSVSEAQILDVESSELTALSEVELSQRAPDSFSQVSWGARYKSRNDDVDNIEIPLGAEPDHVYTKDSMDFVVVKKCNCSDQSKLRKTKIQATDDLVTRKLILTREKSLHFECGCCGESAQQKQIEKHIEAELYCKSE